MLRGERVLLRAMKREDLPRLCEMNNDVEVELVSGGDPPKPQTLEHLQAEYDQRASKGGRDEGIFAIEADGKLIGQAGVVSFHETFRHCELGIIIGDKEYWGRGYGREVVNL